MLGKLGWRGIIALVFVAGVVIFLNNNNGRTVHQPINLMAGTPASMTGANTVSAILPTATNAAPLVIANASVQNVSSQAPINVENARLHTVVDGENLYRIALQYNITAEMIATANGITDVTQIYAGQTLMIPGVEAQSDAIAVGELPTSETVSNPPTLMPTHTIDPTIPQLPSATYPPPPDNVNGIPIDLIAAMPQGVIAHIRNIYAIGQSIGAQPTWFVQTGRQHHRKSTFSDTLRHGAV